MKNNKKPIMFDYNKPIEADKIEVISFEDNGKAKLTKFIYNSRYYTHKYTYGNFYGYTFIYEYDNDSQQKNHLHQLGGRLIYSSTLEVDCTPFGKYLEYSLMKTQALKKSISVFIVLCYFSFTIIFKTNNLNFICLNRFIIVKHDRFFVIFHCIIFLKVY